MTKRAYVITLVITSALLSFAVVTAIANEAYAQVSAAPILNNPGTSNPFYAEPCIGITGASYTVTTDSGGVPVWQWTGSGSPGSWATYFDTPTNCASNTISPSTVVVANPGDYFYVFASGVVANPYDPSLDYGYAALGHYVFDNLSASTTFSLNGHIITLWETNISDSAHFTGVFIGSGPTSGGQLPTGSDVYGYYVGPYVPVTDATSMESLLSSGSGTGNIPNINWGSITAAPPFTLGTTTTAIASSSGLWGSIAIASSSLSCSTGNVFSDALCSAGAFLLLPSPGVISQMTTLPNTAQSRFPFSWIFGLQTVYSGITASSSANMADVVIPFQSVGIGSTTAMGDILPDVTILSSTTITTYLSPNILNTLLFLETVAIWVLFAYFIYHDITHRNRLLKQ